MIRVVDYIADFLYKKGISHVFLVTGGGMMFLSDGVAKHPKLKAVCTHHEQAAAMAATAYSKYKTDFSACYVTTGCGGTNAITGLLNAWQDSMPCIFISGQCKKKETIRNSNLPLRQLGVQEADILSIIEPLTKYAVMVNDPFQIAYQLEKASFIAKNGRFGPVWLDIPLDVQGALVNPEKIDKFEPEKENYSITTKPKEEDVNTVYEMLKNAKRPIVIAGQGIRLSNSIDSFKKFIESYSLPFVVSKLGTDLLPSNHALLIGRIGNKGDRAGNFVVANSDLLISIGCRLSVSSTGHEYDKFAREAKKIVIDIDAIEHKKNTVKIDLFIQSDADEFLSCINKFNPILPNESWIEKTQSWKQKYPVFKKEYESSTEGINLYTFTNSLSKVLRTNDVVISDAGSSFYVITQGLMIKNSQRSITTGGQAEMGYSLPAAIGVCYANGLKDIIAITGDGSFQMNLQEMQTIVHNKLPIKTFVWNNDGYLSIRASQKKFFDGRFIGTDSKSGISFPDLKKIADAYGMKFFKLENNDSLPEKIQEVLNFNGPVLCEVICIRDQEIIPTSSSMRLPDGRMVSKPLEDMYPFLDREEFYREMIIKPLKES